MDYQHYAAIFAVMRQIDQLDVIEATLETEQGAFRRLSLGELGGDRWFLDVSDDVYAKVAA